MTRPRLGIRGKLVLLVTLLSCLPLAGLAYSLAGCMLAWEGAPAGPLHNPVLVVVSGLLLAGAGGFVIWDLVGRLGREEARAAAPRPAGAPAQAGVMTNAWQRMLCTIERQTEELDRFSARLDSAYQELETANARLRDLSYKDELTRLYNRRFFAARLEEEIARHRRFEHPVALVLLDVDGFKAVNDDLGHAAGDETLRGVAEILLKHSRGIDVIGRHGGDEFAVLLVESTKAGARRYAERIQRMLAAYPFAHGRRVTASFGVAALPEDGLSSADALIQAADDALYAAKRAGKDRVALYAGPLARESQPV
jgi:diguanylate cyclase (GGDEF)-like protein